MERRKVFVPNKSHHDFSGAARFGDLVFLTEGVVKRLNVNHLYREISDKLKDATADDYILVSSLSILNAIIASIMAYRFGRINFLIFNHGDYYPREVVLSGIAK